MPPIESLIFKGFLLVVTLMGVLWWIHLEIKNAGIVDFGWALGLALLGALYAYLGWGYGPRRALVACMALIWGLRLAGLVLFDRVVNKPEDARYKTLREHWKSDVPLKFFLFFEMQGILDLLLALPFLFMSINVRIGILPLEWVGLGIWTVAVLGESVADFQLKRFKTNPDNKGKTCRVGLWNYSRHPNYFFEWLVWVAYFVAAVASPHGGFTLLGPTLMFYFLFKVTGIPATEAQAIKSRGDDYRNYQRTTSSFVPWFHKTPALSVEMAGKVVE